MLSALALFSFASILAGAATAAQGADSQPTAGASIVGGSTAPIESFPWLVYVQSEERPKAVYSCTGTVVAPRLILTAGHCVLTESGGLFPAANVLVASGVGDVSQAREANAVYTVVKTLMFPGFDPGTLHADAGLLVLSRPVAAPPISLATSADSSLLREGVPITVAGWGQRSAEDSGTSELQSAVTTIQSNDYCRQNAIKFYPYFSPSFQLCAADPPTFETGPCHGDSGGPAIALRSDGTPVEVGITSLGSPKCLTTLPSVFTRVDLVSSWVAQWAAAIETGAPAPKEAFPRVPLPVLATGIAKRLIRTGLIEDLKYRFAQGHSRQMACARVEKEKVKCWVTWWQGSNDYYGSVTVFLTQSRGAIYWDLRYKIHWVDDYCWFRSGHRQTCAIGTASR
jgi:secreted trypsin-like serine protease